MTRRDSNLQLPSFLSQAQKQYGAGATTSTPLLPLEMWHHDGHFWRILPFLASLGAFITTLASIFTAFFIVTVDTTTEVGFTVFSLGLNSIDVETHTAGSVAEFSGTYAQYYNIALCPPPAVGCQTALAKALLQATVAGPAALIILCLAAFCLLLSTIDAFTLFTAGPMPVTSAGARMGGVFLFRIAGAVFFAVAVLLAWTFFGDLAADFYSLNVASANSTLGELVLGPGIGLTIAALVCYVFLMVQTCGSCLPGGARGRLQPPPPQQQQQVPATPQTVFAPPPAGVSEWGVAKGGSSRPPIVLIAAS